MDKTVISWEDETDNTIGRTKKSSVFDLQFPRINTLRGQSSDSSCPVEIECAKKTVSITGLALTSSS